MKEGDDKSQQIVEEKLEITRVDSLEREIGAFVEAVRERKKPPVSGDDGIRAMEVAIRINDELREFMKRHSGWAIKKG